MTNELSATADSRSRTFSGTAMAEDRTCIWAVRWNFGGSQLVLLAALFTLPVFLVYRFVFTFGRYCALKWRGNSHNDCIYLAYWKVGGAINRSLISAHFPTTQTYKRMRLSTRVYGIHNYMRDRKRFYMYIYWVKSFNYAYVIVVKHIHIHSHYTWSVNTLADDLHL